MIVIEYEFLKNSKGVTSQFHVYYKGRTISPTYRSEFADNPSYPVISEPIESIVIGWGIKPNFDKEIATIFGPYKWNSVGKEWEKIDKKECVSWLVAIRKKGGKKYDN